jgi:hypothetical protein
MKKTICFAICLLLIGALGAQDQPEENPKVIQENLTLKRILGPQNIWQDDTLFSTQATQGDRSRILMLTSYVTDDTGEIMQCLDLLATEWISFFVEFTTIFNTDVRFHFIWTGPEFYYHVTDWYEARYNEYYYFSVDTNTDWKKGVYKLVIMAEQWTKGGGAHSVHECNIKFY